MGSVKLIMLALGIFVATSRAFNGRITPWSSKLMRRVLSTGPLRVTTYLEVPFDERDTVKILGGKWDTEQKKWYVPEGVNPNPFMRWTKFYLNVPFADKEEVKSHGAKWDTNEKKWYITSTNDASQFEKWLGAQRPAKPVPLGEPRLKVKELTPDELREKENNVLIIDCDTNGLPAIVDGKQAPYNHLSHYDNARVIHLSYVLCDRDTFESKQNGSFFIKNDGYPIENSEFHGISKEVTMKRGVEFRDAAQVLVDAVRQSSYLVAHNADFVLNCLKSEMLRRGFGQEVFTVIDKVKVVCAMKDLRNVVQLKDKLGNTKNVKLAELVKFALNENLPQMRNSEVDVEYVRRSLKKLVENDKAKVFSPNP